MFTIDFNNIISNTLGPIHGLRPDDIDEFVSSTSYVPVSVNSERTEGKHPFLNLPYENISVIEKAAKQKAHSYEDFIVLGIGGSALGASALHTALHPPFYNLLTPRARKGLPRLFVLDNVDPTETAALLNVICSSSTC
ncbi:MAG: hypothetical protein HY762_08745 [Planctomycetes bacterium]|nr:hypothetical protein [Planctomycetota bacterium]